MLTWTTFVLPHRPRPLASVPRRPTNQSVSSHTVPRRRRGFYSTDSAREYRGVQPTQSVSSHTVPRRRRGFYATASACEYRGVQPTSQSVAIPYLDVGEVSTRPTVHASSTCTAGSTQPSQSVAILYLDVGDVSTRLPVYASTSTRTAASNQPVSQ